MTGTAQTPQISAIYFDANGIIQSENNIIIIPWSKSFVIKSDVPAITFQTAVANATPNKTITAKIIVGGVVKFQQTGMV